MTYMYMYILSQLLDNTSFSEMGDTVYMMGGTII